MQLQLAGKTALVTGGSRGIGRAIASRLKSAGAQVGICGRTSASLDEACKALGVKGVVADVAQEGDVDALFEFADRELGPLDILINNAGIGTFAPLGDLKPEQWRRLLDTNLSGVFYCSRAAIARMAPRGGGWIINISSLAARNPFAGGAAYNASKFGLNGLTEAMMLDHRHQGIRTSVIMPGSVSTEFSQSSRADWKIAPEDVADAVAMVLAMPERTLISRVEMRPSRPPK